MRLLICISISIIFFSCNSGGNKPDVSHIDVTTSVVRFDEVFFSIDISKISSELVRLQQEYPEITRLYLSEILNADPGWDETTLYNYVKGFIRSHQFVFDTSQVEYNNFEPYHQEINQGLKYVKYYFPAYSVPEKIITYLGPLDGYGDILDHNSFLVGLQHHLGSAFSGYQYPWVLQIYPAYISSRFTPATVSVNAFKNIALDLYPEQFADKSLLIQMVEKGKRLYLLQSFLPDKKEHLLIGYSEEQLKACYDHEAIIWDLFVQNNYLQTIDYNIIKNYIGESPKTQALGEAAPGNIGSFAGWQVVKKYMQKFPETTVLEMMQMNPEALFEQAKYKP